MQNHLDSSGRTFTSMLPSDPFGPPSHDFTSMNSHHHPGGSPGSDFGHLMNSNQNHNSNNSNPLNNNHLHHNNNHSSGNNNNNNSNHGGGGGTDVKPKKAPPPNGKKTKGRVKIKMEFIDNKLRRYTTFSKRKTGIMKKAYELSTLTGTQVMLLVASETGHVYTFATRKLQPMITSEAGKALIQTCLNSPDPPNSGSDTQRMSATGYEETELTYAADPTGSDHGDVKDDEMSETGSSDGDDQKEVPGLLPLSNGLLPPNFAALLASATVAAGLGAGAKGGLTIENVMASQGPNHSSRAGVLSISGAAHLLPPSSLASSSGSTTATTQSSHTTSSNSSTGSSNHIVVSSHSSHHNHHPHHHHHHHSNNQQHQHSHHHQNSSNKTKSVIKSKRDNK